MITNALQTLSSVLAAAEPGGTVGLHGVVIDHAQDTRGTSLVLIPVRADGEEWDGYSAGKLFGLANNALRPVNAKIKNFDAFVTTRDLSAYKTTNVHVDAQVVAGIPAEKPDGFTRFWAPDAVPEGAVICGGGVLVRGEETHLPLFFDAFKFMNEVAHVKIQRYDATSFVVYRLFKPSIGKLSVVANGRKVAPAQRDSADAAAAVLACINRIQIKRVLPAFKILD